MRAELLVHRVALALQRLGILLGDAEQMGDALVDREDIGRPAIQVRAVAGAVFRIFAHREQSRRARIRVDQVDERVAFGVAQEVGHGVHLRRLDPGAPDSGVRLQPRRDVAPDLRTRRRGTAGDSAFVLVDLAHALRNRARRRDLQAATISSTARSPVSPPGPRISDKAAGVLTRRYRRSCRPLRRCRCRRAAHRCNSAPSDRGRRPRAGDSRTDR